MVAHFVASDVQRVIRVSEHIVIVARNTEHTDKYICSIETGFEHRRADFCFVPIGLRGVDVPRYQVDVVETAKIICCLPVASSQGFQHRGFCIEILVNTKSQQGHEMTCQRHQSYWLSSFSAEIIAPDESCIREFNESADIAEVHVQ